MAATPTIDTTNLVAFFNEVLSAKNTDGSPVHTPAMRMTAANHLLTLIGKAEKNG
jgi:hypothetical protein